MKLFDKLFGTYSQRQIRRIEPIAAQIEALAERFSAMPDRELRGMTNVFRDRLAAGETLDDLLPEAFAAVREADFRVLGKRPFHVQLLGGILLHQGRIAEMKTGEGKTLVATLPAYLNALSGNGVHIVTVNDYLARRDSEEMGRVYAFLGLRTGLVVPGLSPDEKREAYAADITYGTNNEFGFDYLRDNMVIYKSQQVQRGHAFAIVDEVDSILIDEARTPLIISGNSTKSTDFYEKADQLARRLRPKVLVETDSKKPNDIYEEDYVVDEKARAYLRRRVDFNPRPPAHEKRQKPRQHRYMQCRMQKMDAAVRRYRNKAGGTEEDLEKSARTVRYRRVVALSREIVASDSPPCVHVITSCNKKEGPLSQAP